MKQVDLVVVLGEKLRLFSSIAAAEARLDPADLRGAPSAEALDRHARPHRLRIDDNGWGQETLRIVPAFDAAPAPDRLAAHLASLLSRHGLTVRATPTLADLLRRAAPFCEA